MLDDVSGDCSGTLSNIITVNHYTSGSAFTVTISLARARAHTLAGTYNLSFRLILMLYTHLRSADLASISVGEDVTVRHYLFYTHSFAPLIRRAR